ncbi:MAG TPA: HlyD family efflux transporter periplasmic adaptor subunit [Archangium sp.]|uniref:efflux RND transporter periplasmic adaptor subunit n=1 Tax=Archangium sp. TaxID=1872627 RepID=UPI002E35C6E5|nr:HlyD family efflux transporter periplasmic adaptor subunit [Archangium sp.]HEX5747947.1 HlyD family efflux transporter periplasmic adaptor subunit [Archangium sp.]
MKYRVPLEDPRVRAFERVRPLGFARRLARWLGVLFLLLAVALAFIPWQQTAHGEGHVVAYSPTERQQRVDAPVAGWLEEWFVQEGTHVRQGDPIARIADNDPKLMERLRAEQQAAQAAEAAAGQALETARRDVTRQRRLLEQGLSARKQLEEAQLKEASMLKDLTDARAARARINTRLAQQGRQQVTAPRDGTILRRTAGADTIYIKQGEELAILVPDTRSQAVELWMDGNHLPLLASGQEVRLQFEGWPALQFSGWPSAAVGTFGGQVAIIDAGTERPGQFRLLAVPSPGADWPDSRWLRQGVRVHGWVMLGQVPLGYELWRRFNDFPPTLPTPPSKEARGGKEAEKDTAAPDEGAGKK